MASLTKQARLFILATLIVGGVVLARQLTQLPGVDVWLLLALSVIASAAQVFKVEGATARSSYNISWIVFSFTLIRLGAPAALLVALVAHLVEWAWYRYEWYIQTFNIATYAITIQAAGLVAQWAGPNLGLPGWATAAVTLAALLTFTLANHILIGLVIMLARGESLTRSGVLAPLTLMIDASLLCLGATAAFVWTLNPYAVLVALVPVYLIYSTLKVPALQRQAVTDPKTGLYNSRYFTTLLAQELDRANRFDRPMTVVMADLDLLRNINNTYGHLAGDVVLAGVAQLLQKSVRTYDVVARFGGEEFCILMPETHGQDAWARIEAMRAAIEAAEFEVPTSVTPIRATMSFGVAERRGFDQSSNDILHSADLAVYQAKLNGRNRLSLPPEGPLLAAGRRPPGSDSAPAAQAAAQVSPPRPPEKPAAPAAPPLSRLKPSSPWLINIYVGAVALAAVGLLGFAFHLGGFPDWLGLAVFLIIALAAEWLAIDIYARDTSVSTSAAPLIAAALLFGPVGALTTSLVLAGVAFIKHRSRPKNLVFNAANHLLSSLWCVGLVAWLPTPFLQQSTLAQVVIGIASGGIVYLSSTLLLAGAIHFDSGQAFRQAWSERFAWLWPYYLAMGLVAFALTFGYHTAGILGILAVVIPLLMLRFGQAQYIEHTKKLVQQLRGTNSELVRRTDEISALNEELLLALSHAIDLRDPFVLGHSQQVARYATLVAHELGLPLERVEVVRKAALLHDVGKLGIPESILFKPGRLTSAEFEVVKLHVTLGANIIEDCNSLRPLVPLVRHHHEYFDGHGYPDQLNGQVIPLESRILSLADAVEAMASDRPYRKGMDTQAILEEVQSHAGTQFDPDVAAAFARVVQRLGPAVIVNSAQSIASQAAVTAATSNAPFDLRDTASVASS